MFILETDNPKITRVSHAVRGNRENKVLLEWRRMLNVESYNVFTRVKDATIHNASTSDTSYVLDNVDGSETTELWITTVMNDREGLPSAPVTVPRVTRKFTSILEIFQPIVQVVSITIYLLYLLYHPKYHTKAIEYMTIVHERLFY